ncbi:hypothetical protein AB0H42_01605 [Nocardia sp. NPDC050799]|uniref:hypothetical protein n=1 Tax=Nocardia sp. NPDC050799 TaxID=3154842 RepID=UPI00340AC5EB
MTIDDSAVPGLRNMNGDYARRWWRPSSWRLRTRFGSRGIYAFTATLCLAATVALVRRYR